MKTNKNKITFLDEFLSKMIKPKKRRVIKLSSEIEYEKRNKKYYSRLNRLIKKHNITFHRDLSYWDFYKDGKSRTIGLNENVEDYITAYNFVKDEIEDGTFFTNG